MLLNQAAEPVAEADCKYLIEAACKKLSMDERQLANKLGVSVGSLRSWKQKPPFYAALALAAVVLEISPANIEQSLRRGMTEGG